MPSNETQRLAQIIKESIDNVDITSKFRSSEPCIIKGHESLTSNEISYDQAVNDAIHDFIEDLIEFGMGAHYVDITSRGIHIRPINPNAMHAVMPAVIGGLNHNIIIADDIKLAKKMKEPGLIQFDCCKEQKQPKENHPHGWYRKFDKKRY